MPTIELPPDIYNRLIRLSNARPYPATTVDQEVELAAEAHLALWEAFYFGERPHRPMWHTTETEHD